MSILLLAVLVLLVGGVTYTLLSPLVRPVRVIGACALMLSMAAFIVKNRDVIPHQGNFSGAGPFPIFSDQRAPDVPNPSRDAGREAYGTFQSISQEDQNFLDDILQRQNQDDQQQGKPAPSQAQIIGKVGNSGSGNEPVLKGELVINTAEAKRSKPLTHKETVKRAELVRFRHGD